MFNVWAYEILVCVYVVEIKINSQIDGKLYGCMLNLVQWLLVKKLKIKYIKHHKIFANKQSLLADRVYDIEFYFPVTHVCVKFFDKDSPMRMFPGFYELCR